MKRITIWTVALLGLALIGTGIATAEPKVGDMAPDFELRGTDGETYRLSDMKGKTVVLAWFPKAFTGG